MLAIFRARAYATGIPNNLGVIFRKTFRSLEDSTLKDFEKYAGVKVPSNRELHDDNGSITLFRHIDELDSINQQNLNLGWFMIEQGEELDSDKEFFMLFGRLRRVGEPNDEFKSLGFPLRSGWVIANAGDNWIKKLWKDGKIQQAAMELGEDGRNFSELIEATTFDNQHNLPRDFILSLKMLEKTKPEVYKQFVLNDWSVGFKNKVFTEFHFNIMRGRQGFLARYSINAGVAVDPAGDGTDDNVFLAGCGGEVFEKYKQTTMSPSDRAHKAIMMCRAVKGSFIIIDCDGVGIDTYLELVKFQDTYSKGIEIVKFHGSAKSVLMESERPMYANLRAEAAFITRKRAVEGRAGIDENDFELMEDLKEEEFFTNTRGLIQLEPKDDIKERLGRSPGCGDAYKMLQWAFEQGYKSDSRAYEDTHDRLPQYAINDDNVMNGRYQMLPRYAEMG